MKKLILIMITLIMAVTLTGCGNDVKICIDYVASNYCEDNNAKLNYAWGTNYFYCVDNINRSISDKYYFSAEEINKCKEERR